MWFLYFVMSDGYADNCDVSCQNMLNIFPLNQKRQKLL